MKVRNSQITDYMLSLYPEFDNYSSLEKFLVENCNLSGDYFIDEFMRECMENGSDIPESTDGYEKVLDILRANDLKFAPYFAGFIGKHYSRIYNAVFVSGLTDDPDSVAGDAVCRMYSSLYNIAIRVLVFELEIAKDEGMLKGGSPEERFEYFSEKLLSDEKYLSSLHDEYQMMYRLIFDTAEKTADFIADILNDTVSEYDRIKNELCGGKDTGKLLYIRLSGGDTHKDCRSVTVLVFENARIVYKPHSLESETAFQELLGFFNNFIEEKNRLRIMKTVCGQGYGFTEFIEHLPADSKKDVSLFYTKAGILMGILYLCNVSDCHFENIISCGSDPVLIDIETIFHCILPDVLHLNDKESAFVNVRKFLNSSVNSIGLLPAYIDIRGENNEHKRFSVGGMAGSAAQESPLYTYDIKNIGSDNMSMERSSFNIESSCNSPVLDGKETDPREYSKEIASGFEAIYRIIMQNKEKVREKIISLFSGTYNRIVLKATMIYGNLLNIATHPDFMRNEIYARFLFSRAGLIPTAANVTDYETASLLSRTVPIYYAGFSEKYIVNGNGTIYENVLDKSPMEEFLDKINNFSEKDLSVQLHLIKTSYYVPDEKYEHCCISFHDEPVCDVSNSELLAEAEATGNYLLEERSISGINQNNNNDRFYFGCTVERCEYEDYTTVINNLELYNGSCGTALFLYHLGRISGKKHFIDAAFESLEPLKTVIASGNFNMVNNTGAFTGISGYFYVLSEIAESENSIEMRRLICDSLHYISEFAENERNKIDLISGTSGALAVLLNIFHKTSDEELRKTALDEAVKCFDIICGSVFRNGIIDTKKVDLCGFSHGISGAVPYIYDYYLVTGNENALAFTKELLRYERETFRVKKNGRIIGWHSAKDNEGFMTSWCHGTAGILLEKVMLKKSGYSDSELDEELAYALDITKKECIGTAMAYCHGDLGNITILEMYARYAGDEYLLKCCRSTFAELFEKYIRDIRHNSGVLCQKYNGLMVGLAGVGYACLNKCDDSLPVFLSLE